MRELRIDQHDRRRPAVTAPNRPGPDSHPAIVASAAKPINRVPAWVYGGPLTTGYQAGEIRFGPGAIALNLRYMPAHLMQAMPALTLGLAALAWIIVRRLVTRRAGGQVGAVARRDLCVGLGLGSSWFAVWALYAAYYWTTDPSETTLQAARFYVPAIGAIALLGAWLVTRIPGRAWLAGLSSAAVVAGMFGVGASSFHAMVASISSFR